MRECIFKRHYERRIKARHKAPLLTVKANFVGLFTRARHPITMQCVDFNRYGMAVTCDHKLKTGDKLEFSFRGRYITEDGIQGMVSSVTEIEDGYRYGILFCYCRSSRDYSRETDNALSRIEGLFGQFDQSLRPQAS